MAWEFEPIGGTFEGTTEGPAWDGEALLFTYIPANGIVRYDPATGQTSMHRSDSNGANGLVFDPQGVLYACEGRGRRMVRYEADGSTTVLADRYQGKRLNRPNDLAIDLQGRVWFTDPLYSGPGGVGGGDAPTKELDHDSVFRLDRRDGEWSITRVTTDTTKPNGILFSLDHRTLYVAQTAWDPEDKRELRAYPVKDDGTLGPYGVLHDFGAYRGIDGMCLDTEGNIVATAGYLEGGPGPSIYVFSPTGEVLERHPLPGDRPSNCTFGDADLRTLYVTTVLGPVFRARTERQGRLLFPRPKPA